MRLAGQAEEWVPGLRVCQEHISGAVNYVNQTFGLFKAARAAWLERGGEGAFSFEGHPNSVAIGQTQPFELTSIVVYRKLKPPIHGNQN